MCMRAQANTQVSSCALYTVSASFEVSGGVDLNAKLRKILRGQNPALRLLT
jgi:hypothetical protein